MVYLLLYAFSGMLCVFLIGVFDTAVSLMRNRYLFTELDNLQAGQKKSLAKVEDLAGRAREQGIPVTSSKLMDNMEQQLDQMAKKDGPPWWLVIILVLTCFFTWPIFFFAYAYTALRGKTLWLTLLDWLKQRQLAAKKELNETEYAIESLEDEKAEQGERS